MYSRIFRMYISLVSFRYSIFVCLSLVVYSTFLPRFLDIPTITLHLKQIFRSLIIGNLADFL